MRSFSILAGLGVAMLLAILFLRLSGPVQAAAGTAILLLMQFLPGVLSGVDLGIWSPVRLLLVPGSVGSAFVLYPPIPWLGVVLLGMAFARLLLQDQHRACQVAAVVGLACLALFPLVRALGVVWSRPGGLPGTYLAWVVGLILLYPVCKTFEAFKHSMPATSVWRML